MALDLHLRPDPGDSAFGVDEHGRALDAHIGAAIHAFFLPDPIGLQRLEAFVGGERNAKLVLPDEGIVLLNGIGRKADESDAGRLEIRSCGGKILCFRRAGRRVILRVEEEDDRPAAQRREGNASTAITRKGEVRGNGARSQFCHGISFLWPAF